MPMTEALELLQEQGIALDRIRVRGFPFGEEVRDFISRHERVFVVDQNRDGQMRSLLINEGVADPAKLVSVRYYAGLSISADTIRDQVHEHYKAERLPRLKEVGS